MIRLNRRIPTILPFLFLLLACEKNGGVISSDGGADFTYSVSSVGPGSGHGNGNDSSHPAGILTAGEWNDYDHWDFWQNLIKNDTFAEFENHWGFYCRHRWSFSLTDPGGLPVADAVITLFANGAPVWEGHSNRFGQLRLIPFPFSQNLPSIIQYKISYQGGRVAEGSLGPGDQDIHVVVASGLEMPQQADLMFVVDATGSMGDEISYLKNELLDVLNRAGSQSGAGFRYSCVFYRDHGDEYLTRPFPFNSSAVNTASFVNDQNADGGGDTPEAVEEALATALQQDWSSSAKARLMFLILDAPPHDDPAILARVREEVKEAAAKGICIIPVAASGIDKSTEFLLRFMALATNGTYTFLTNDSGIGNDHITPTVGEYKVEYLNNLMVRLITYYAGN